MSNVIAEALDDLGERIENELGLSLNELRAAKNPEAALLDDARAALIEMMRELANAKSEAAARLEDWHRFCADMAVLREENAELADTIRDILSSKEDAK
jgi:hypothetical protein